MKFMWIDSDNRTFFNQRASELLSSSQLFTISVMVLLDFPRISSTADHIIIEFVPEREGCESRSRKMRNRTQV